MKLTNSPEEVNFGDGRIPRIGQGRLPTESSGSAGRQAAPSLRKPFLPPPRPPQPRRWRGRPGSQERGQVSGARADPRGASRVGRAAAAASPAGPGARKLREGNSRASKPLPRTTHGLRHLQPPLSPGGKTPASPGSQRSANSAGPGGQEGHRRACKQALFVSPQPEPRLPPSPGAHTRRPPAGPVTTPAPGRCRALTRGPHPSESTRPLPEKPPGSR